MINQAENPETGTVAVRRQKQLGRAGGARSEELGGAQDLLQGLAMGIFASSDRCGADVRAAGTA